jgi:ketosteroid isomerase-like protein
VLGADRPTTPGGRETVASAPQENVAFARAAYEAIERGDIPYLEAHTHPDVLFQQGGRFPTAGTFHGRDAMFGHFMAFMTMVEGRFSMQIHDILAGNERVAVYITVTVGYRGEELVFDEVHLWRIEDGLLVEMHAIPFDPYALDAFFANAAS